MFPLLRLHILFLLWLTMYVALVQEDDIRKYTSDQVPMADPSLGTGIRRPEDSVYYHPTINPGGLPPAGKPQRYRTSLLLEGPSSSANSAAALPVPKPPPLPQGPAPQLALPAPPGVQDSASAQQAAGMPPGLHQVVLALQHLLPRSDCHQQCVAVTTKC